MDRFEKREREIFETLKKIKDHDFALVGGYSVNTYTLPRFSTDCDIVVMDNSESKKIESILIRLGYTEDKEGKSETSYYGEFKRYVKEIQAKFKVSIDILIKEVLDRQTNSTFSAHWIFENSSKQILQGKTILEELALKIINIDALFVMKAISCRNTDIRDIFMLVSDIKDKKWIISEIKQRYDFTDRLTKIEEKVNSIGFKNSLQSVFGKLPENTFVKQKGLISKLKE